jgi:hypothetical protein
VLPFCAWLESTGVSVWVRESSSILAFPAILSAHAIGMGLAAGLNSVMALRVLGVAAPIPFTELRRFAPVMWFGFWLNAASGVVLFVGYPTKALTNPVFYLKLALITVAMALSVRRLRDAPDSPQRTRVLAAATLVSWAGAIFAGRFLAYTYTRLMADG